jgi:hypothetical protein
MIGWLSCPEGWETMKNSGQQYFKSATQRWTVDPPPGAKPEGAIALANAIPDMRALSKLIFGGGGGSDSSGKWKENLEPATLEVGMTNANFSYKALGEGGAIIISAWLAHKDKGAVTKFDISSNGIRAEGGKALAAGLECNQVIKELNISGNKLGYNSNTTDTSGIIAIADVIPGMGAMTSLDLANNVISAEGARHIAAAIKVINCVFLALFSCPSTSCSTAAVCYYLRVGYEGAVLSGSLQKQDWGRWCCIYHRCAEDARN